MPERDYTRVEMIMRAAEAGVLTDLTVVAVLAQVRAEAVSAERERQARRLQQLAYQQLVRGDRSAAQALEDAAGGLELTAPTIPAQQ